MLDAEYHVMAAMIIILRALDATVVATFDISFERRRSAERRVTSRAQLTRRFRRRQPTAACYHIQAGATTKPA